jgi:hypothetical protein
MENGHTTNATSQLERAFISTRAILAEVQPDQLEKSTPCTSWDVRTLIDHFVGSARWGATTLGWEEEILRSDPDSDFLIAYDAIIDAALAAFGAEGALEQTMELPMGVLSGGDVLAIVTRDRRGSHLRGNCRCVGRGDLGGPPRSLPGATKVIRPYR